MGIFSKTDKPTKEQAANDKAYQEALAKENKENLRKKGESNQAYNERVPVAFQPVKPMGKIDYLGRPIE